jgi:glucokinase
VLSGGVLPAWEYFAPSMLETVKRRSYTFRAAKTEIKQAILGNEAGLYGACNLPWSEA